MRRNNNTPAHRDEAQYETVLMRRFHLTPGESEYVFVKRRLPVTVPVTATEPLLPFRGGVMPGRARSQKRTVEQRHGLFGSEAKKGVRATVNKINGGGKPSGPGHGKPVSRATPRKGGSKGGAASSGRSAHQPRSETVHQTARIRAGLKTRLRPSATNTRLQRKQAHRPGHSVVPR